MSCTSENKERCEQQKCACRPDCVTRDVLERLDSPDLQLALMELDRKNGVDVGDGLSTADRIVASGPTPRRKRMREEEVAEFESASSGKSGRGRKGSSAPASASAKGKAQGKNDATGEELSGRRRRRRPAEGDERASMPAASDGMTTPDAAPGGRRRRHRSGDGAQAAAREGAARQAGTAGESAGETQGRSRRRTHVASGDAATSQAASAGSNGANGQRRKRSRKPETLSVADQLAEGDVKVQRRRPGDGGGAQGQARMAADPAAQGEDAPKSAADAGIESPSRTVRTVPGRLHSRPSRWAPGFQACRTNSDAPSLADAGEGFFMSRQGCARACAALCRNPAAGEAGAAARWRRSLCRRV